MEQEDKVYSRVSFKSPALVGVLNNLRTQYEESDHQYYLVVPYVLTCAAYLEAKLNDSMMQFSLEHYDEQVAEALMSLSLPRKLESIVPMLTSGQYKINKSHFVYQRLISLIRTRNELTHAKASLKIIPEKDAKAAATPAIFSNEPIDAIVQRHMRLHEAAMGPPNKFTPTEYHEALEKFEKWFFQRSPDRLSKVAMVVSTKNKWEMISTVMLKHLDPAKPKKNAP